MGKNRSSCVLYVYDSVCMCECIMWEGIVRGGGSKIRVQKIKYGQTKRNKIDNGILSDYMNLLILFMYVAIYASS